MGTCKRTDDLISHILLSTFSLGSEERRNGSAGQVTTDLTRTGSTEFGNDRRVFLAKTAWMEEDRVVVPLEPPNTSHDRLSRREQSQRHESNHRLGKHVENRIASQKDLEGSAGRRRRLERNDRQRHLVE